MIKTLRGTKDILPSEVSKWHYLEDKIREATKVFGYKELRTPILEHTEVFSRSIGQQTDIVNKEMYTFEDRGGESVTLRPEMTAALVRSAIQQKFSDQGPIKRLWYMGPFFRYERPQAGRFRQFHQFGAECLNANSPISDVEAINLALHLTFLLDIKNYVILINSIGNKISRDKYISQFSEFLNDNSSKLSELSQKRLIKNPLRILDSKDKNDIELLNSAPEILDFLDSESSDHFDEVRSILDAVNVNYKIEPKLVRGLDYYSHTVFEFRSDVLGSQDSFGGGGRYNELFSQLGAKKDIPAVGFAMGLERLIIILENQKLFSENENAKGIYLVKADEKASLMIENVLKIIRRRGLFATLDLTGKSVKSQFKDAGKNSFEWVITIGENEIISNTLAIKNMIESKQINISLDELDTFNF
jgi:histidyl-tRNA synthetase